MKKTIKICSETWDLLFDKKLAGGRCHYLPRGKKSFIRVGCNSPDPQHRLTILMHEILESILMVDQRRYEHEAGNGGTDYVFVFDHNYLDGLDAKIVEALLSSGEFKIATDSGAKKCFLKK